MGACRHRVRERHALLVTLRPRLRQWSRGPMEVSAGVKLRKQHTHGRGGRDDDDDGPPPNRKQKPKHNEGVTVRLPIAAARSVPALPLYCSAIARASFASVDLVSCLRTCDSTYSMKYALNSFHVALSCARSTHDSGFPIRILLLNPLNMSDHCGGGLPRLLGVT